MILGEFELTEPLPDLHNTCAIVMLRPWIDVGRAATLVLTQLEQHLGAKELGRLARPGTYFDFTRYRPRTRIVVVAACSRPQIALFTMLTTARAKETTCFCTCASRMPWAKTTRKRS